MSDRAFLHSNILVYAYYSSCPEKQSRAQLLNQNGFLQEDAVLSPQVLGEFFVVVTRKIPKPLSATAALDIIEIFQSLVAVDIDYALVSRAIEAQIKFKISYWDGLIIAAAERAQCKRILSEDLNIGQTYWGIRIENPGHPVAADIAPISSTPRPHPLQ